MQIGQYVKYEPNASDSYPSEEAHNGKGLQNISQEKLNWRILSISGNIVKIISDSNSTNVYYQVAEGYNNAVKDLNDMCEALYSHEDTKARSVNLEDFTNSQWKSSFTQSSGSYNTSKNTFPKIYQYEYSGSLGQSSQDIWYSGTYTSSSVKKTNWSGNISLDSPLYDYTSYWLSSRSVDADVSMPYFSLQCASDKLTIGWLFYMFGNPGAIGKHIRAVVTLPASCTFGNEKGNIANPITINWPEEETEYICGRCTSGNVNHKAGPYGGCHVKDSIVCSKCGHYFVKKCSTNNEDYGTCYSGLEYSSGEVCSSCDVVAQPD